MNRIFLTIMFAILFITFICWNCTTAKRFDKASPLSKSDNKTVENSANIKCPGHADFVKSKDNSTTINSKKHKD